MDSNTIALEGLSLNPSVQPYHVHQEERMIVDNVATEIEGAEHLLDEEMLTADEEEQERLRAQLEINWLDMMLANEAAHPASASRGLQNDENRGRRRGRSRSPSPFRYGSPFESVRMRSRSPPRTYFAALPAFDQREVPFQSFEAQSRVESNHRFARGSNYRSRTPSGHPITLARYIRRAEVLLVQALSPPPQRPHSANPVVLGRYLEDCVQYMYGSGGPHDVKVNSYPKELHVAPTLADQTRLWGGNSFRPVSGSFTIYRPTDREKEDFKLLLASRNFKEVKETIRSNGKAWGDEIKVWMATKSEPGFWVSAGRVGPEWVPAKWMAGEKPTR